MANSDLSIDAVPKKRGPKTDVLEALLKRVDGLEAKLREKGDEDSLSLLSAEKDVAGTQAEDGEAGERPAKRVAVENRLSPGTDTAVVSPRTPIAR